MHAVMKFIIDPAVTDLFPDLRIGVVTAGNIDNSPSHHETAAMLRDAESRARREFELEGLAQNPLISNWRKAYKLLRVKDGRASHEALIRRVLKGNEIPGINTLVDIYNSLSLRYATPLGGEDMDRIVGDIKLRLASGGEDFVQLGSDETTHPDPGEVIYSDDSKVLCRKFNWRESDITKLTENTRNAFFVTETLPPFPEENLRNALRELAGLLEEHCGATTGIHVLHGGRNEIEF